MRYEKLREELKDFYWKDNRVGPVRAFAEKCWAILDETVTEDMSVMAQKLLQYEVIVREFEPVIFRNSPFFCETGVLVSQSDGARWAKNSNFFQANGWTHHRNEHVFVEQDPALWEKRCAQRDEKLYLICGPYNDTLQHFNFNNRPILEGGLKQVYLEAKQALETTVDPEQREFLEGVCQGMLQLKKAAEKFADKAAEMLAEEKSPEAVKNLTLIRDTASRVPWEKPENLYEALATLAFMRKLVGSLEGVGPNTFGRIDVDLYPFYERDLKAGRLDETQAYDLVCQFLILWDMHYDHDMAMVGYGEHELENTYTLGGCDRDGNPVWNPLTRMFLRATREEQIIFPKIKCRFSRNSPKEYLDEINAAVIGGTSTVLYQNDDATIPAILRSGRPLEEARDYFVSGCWGIASNGTEKYDHGSYLNLLKPFEFALHRLQDKMDRVGIQFETYDQVLDFEEFYRITVRNCEKLIRERIAVTRQGGHIWHLADALPIFSSTMEGCIQKKQDFTRGQGKYKDDYLLCFGLPNIVDSLLAIKKLVFEDRKYTLEAYLKAVRNNWKNAEEMRLEATRCCGWGDGSEESCQLANRFNNDLHAAAQQLEGTYGGKVHIGHLTYTEIRWWGEQTLATPDGRFSGDYFSQGLTPSRLKKIDSATSVINSLKALDPATMAASNVVNIILPSNRVSLDICEAFLRSAADSALMALQLNCVTREQLLDAQQHPEKYPHLIVRVCGFSARFTSLSPQWQQEVLSRNFYK